MCLVCADLFYAPVARIVGDYHAPFRAILLERAACDSVTACRWVPQKTSHEVDATVSKEGTHGRTTASPYLRKTFSC